MMKAEWVSAVAEAVVAFFAAFVLLQIFLLKKQIKSDNLRNRRQNRLLKQQIQDDHVRSRRQAAVDSVMAWTTNLTPEMISVQKLIDDFTENQCKDLESIRPLHIGEHHVSLVKSCLPKEETLAPLGADGTVCLTVTQVSQLKFGALRYLNTLESILIAWRHNVADQNIIEEQFRYVLNKSHHTILKKFRDQSGLANYPAIEEFQTKYQQQQKPGQTAVGV